MVKKLLSAQKRDRFVVFVSDRLYHKDSRDEYVLNSAVNKYLAGVFKEVLENRN